MCSKLRFKEQEGGLEIGTVTLPGLNQENFQEEIGSGKSNTNYKGHSLGPPYVLIELNPFHILSHLMDMDRQGQAGC